MGVSWAAAVSKPLVAHLTSHLQPYAQCAILPLCWHTLQLHASFQLLLLLLLLPA
jgi:hypothetical protein